MHVTDQEYTMSYRISAVAAVLIIAFSAVARAKDASKLARGVVFLDQNGNGQRDSTERGLPDIRVSNGFDIVSTDQTGRYRIPVDDDCILFVIKPRDFMTPVNGDNLPKFYYVHRPAGSTKDLKVPGIAPTGPLPDSVDFALYPRKQGDKFSVLLFGDPQPGSPEEIDILAHDVIEELLVPRHEVFGVSLGDLADPRYSAYYNTVVGKIGLPWYNVLGNHDVHEMDPAALTDDDSDDCFQRVYGPGTYSFDHADVHFIVVDNCVSVWDEDRKASTYWSKFTDQSLKFIQNDLAEVPKHHLVVLMFHIPLNQGNRNDLLALLEGRPNTLSLSGHYHEIVQWFFPRPGGGTHHHITCGALCGIHWLGPKDGYGIPAATMHCGSPNGYMQLHVDGQQYRLTFKASRYPQDHQMHIFSPTRIPLENTQGAEIIVNVFMGNEKSKTEMSIGNAGDWMTMQREVRHDPYLLDALPTGHPAGNCQHLWVHKLPAGMQPGTHILRVRSTDMYGKTHTGKRLVHVTADTDIASQAASNK